jgi:protein-L-isoaspartate(D-aspartate) O-methyltransferase
VASRRVGDSYGGYRQRLVERLREGGITDMAVLRAFGEVPRHLFVPEAVRHRAYEDAPLPIGASQTISQPRMQALYLQLLALKGTERVLEIGTGSGYQTALLAYLAETVVSVERVPDLARRAVEAVRAAGCPPVSIVVGDGSLGWRPLAPYDAILVSAVCPSVPEPLVEQLSPEGRMLVPVGKDDRQTLMLVTRTGASVEVREVGDVRFVPLIGRHGFGTEEG